MAEMLADPSLQSIADLEHAFAAFSNLRQKRGQFLVQSSRRMGDIYEWRAEGVGRDFGKAAAEIRERCAAIGDVSVREMCDEAKSALHSGQKAASSLSSL